MSKIKDKKQVQYVEKINGYCTVIENILKDEVDARAAIEPNNPDSGLKRLELTEMMLNLASNYLVINGISQSVLNQRDEEALNEARKTLYKSIIYLEELVSKYIDSPFSDYEEKLAAIESVNAAKRYLLIRKMGLTIQLLVDAYGDNTKWRWSFVELEGRYAVVAKNIVNLKDVVANSDPRSPNYEPTVLHLRLIRKLLMQAADRYREKYELSTNNIDDFKMGINFLSSLKRLNIVTNAQVEVATVQKKLEVWNNKLASDMIKIKESKKG